MTGKVDVHLTSQFQRLTEKIDWVDVFNAYKLSGLSYRDFFQQLFPSVVSKYLPEGYVPSYTTLRDHLTQVNQAGPENFKTKRQNIAAKRRALWVGIYREFKKSWMPLKEFYESTYRYKYCRTTFYTNLRWIKTSITKEEKQMDMDNTVNVFKIEDLTPDNSRKSAVTPVSAELPPPVNHSANVSDRVLTINVGGMNTISFSTSSPEYSAALIIKYLKNS